MGDAISDGSLLAFAGMRAYAVVLGVLGLGLLGGCGRTDLQLASGSAGGTADGTATEGDPSGTADSGEIPPPPTSTTGDPPPPPPFCTIDLECDSPDPCIVGSCEGGVCVTVARDNDGDGEPPPECGGQDCNDLNPNTFPGAPENCFDADDNDCNGVADCFDPACEGVP